MEDRGVLAWPSEIVTYVQLGERLALVTNEL
jgi:hypothetical protein